MLTAFTCNACRPRSYILQACSQKRQSSFGLSSKQHRALHKERLAHGSARCRFACVVSITVRRTNTFATRGGYVLPRADPPPPSHGATQKSPHAWYKSTLVSRTKRVSAAHAKPRAFRLSDEVCPCVAPIVAKPTAILRPQKSAKNQGHCWGSCAHEGHH